AERRRCSGAGNVADARPGDARPAPPPSAMRAAGSFRISVWRLCVCGAWRQPWSILVLLVFLAGGCLAGEEEPGSSQLHAGNARADGTGFIEVVDGQDAELVPGSQGGFHVWINVRVHGLA